MLQLNPNLVYFQRRVRLISEKEMKIITKLILCAFLTSCTLEGTSVLENFKAALTKTSRLLGINLKNRIDDIRHQVMNTEIVKNKIVFNNFNGKGYGCNPKYIAEEIIRQKLPYELVWLVKNKHMCKDEFPKEIKLVEYTIANAIREFASAKVWISNHRMPVLYANGLIKKKEQFYIQTWHGSLGIKKIESALSWLGGDYKKYAKIDSKYINYILSNSLYDDRMFGRNFWYDGVIVRTGHPRCDIFFLSDSEKRKISNKVKKALGIDNTKKILLYCPSFRDDYSLNAYNIDVHKTLNAVKRKFGQEWVFAIRLHPNLPIKAQNNFEYNDDIINATMYPDILDLLLISDIVISDYSSCIFDFTFTRKPAFIYASDLYKYSKDRGFYYPLEESPFSLAQNNQQLINNILNFDNNAYLNKLNDFFKKLNCIEDGHSSERVVNLIKRVIEGK